jgi:hypothetical protein
MVMDNNNIKCLAIKMIKIMKQVGYIQKKGINQFHRYKYATETDVSAAFSKAMIENNVFMFSSVLERDCKSYQTRGNKESFLVTVKLQVTFVDGDSGESFTGVFYGDGSDSDDKGVYKAITGAQKYALMKTFLVATGDDPEKENENEKSNTEKVKNEISKPKKNNNKNITLEDKIKIIEKTMAEKNFDEERKTKAFKYFKINKIEDLTNDKADMFLNQLRK